MSSELLGEDEALEAGGHHRAEARLLVAEDEHVFDPGEVLYQCGDVGCRAGHAGGRQPISEHTRGGDDRRTQHIRLDGIARVWVDGVGDLLAIHDLEVAVVTRGRQPASGTGELYAHLEVIDDARRVCDGLVDTDDPALAS